MPKLAFCCSTNGETEWIQGQNFILCFITYNLCKILWNRIIYMNVKRQCSQNSEFVGKIINCLLKIYNLFIVRTILWLYKFYNKKNP